MNSLFVYDFLQWTLLSNLYLYKIACDYFKKSKSDYDILSYPCTSECFCEEAIKDDFTIQGSSCIRGAGDVKSWRFRFGILCFLATYMFPPIWVFMCSLLLLACFRQLGFPFSQFILGNYFCILYCNVIFLSNKFFIILRAYFFFRGQTTMLKMWVLGFLF